MNREAVELVSYSLIRMVALLEHMPEWITSHSDHVYRYLRLAIKMGFGSILIAIHAVFPFLFSSATKEILVSLCEQAEVCPVALAVLEPKVAPLEPKVAPLEPKVAPLKPKVAPLKPKAPVGLKPSPQEEVKETSADP